MKLQRFDVSENPTLTILDCHGDLDINGGRRGEIAIKAYNGNEALQIEKESEHLTITVTTRCKIGCPHGAIVNVQTVQGGLRIRRVDGPITVETAQGDVVFKEVGAVNIQNVHGDLHARSVDGDLQLGRVQGDLSVRSVSGSFTAETVEGDFQAADLGANLKASVGGDAILRTRFGPDFVYDLNAGGDALLKFAGATDATFQIKAGGHIKHRVNWATIQEENGSLHGVIGEGQATVHITAGSDVNLRSGKGEPESLVMSMDNFGIDLETMAEEIERNIEVHMGRLNAQLEVKLGQIDHEAIQAKAQRAAEKLRRQALRAAERARLQAERQRRRWERVSTHPPKPPTPPTPPPLADPVSDEERMMILRMVQAGKISAQDAAELLKAMGS